MKESVAANRRKLAKIGKCNLLWKRMQDLRIDRQMSHEEVAKKIGVSRSAYTQWERNLTWPSLGLIEQLAIAFHTTPEYIAFGAGRGTAADTIQIPLMDYVDGSSKKPKVVAHLAVDRPFFAKSGVDKLDDLKAFVLSDDPQITGFRKGDRVIIDDNQTDIKGRTPVAIMVQGEPKVAMASMIPATGAPRVKLMLAGETHELPLSKINVIGTVVASMHQA